MATLSHRSHKDEAEPHGAEWSYRLRDSELAILWDLEALQRDPATAELIRQGRTMGCFYIESPSMRSLFQRMHCEHYEDVVAASSIIRPGVAESGMMREYIERHRIVRGKTNDTKRAPALQPTGSRPGEISQSRTTTDRPSPGHKRSLGEQSKIQNPKSKIDYLHPKLKEILAETYGVMVYQEDVIRVVHALGGLTMGEADILRRAMSAKLGAQQAMESLTERFFAGCRERGLPEKTIEELWRQIETFARFSFCKGHSAAFAVLSYQVAWLKAHYPAEFMASVLSNGGGYYRAGAYIQECRRMGLRVLPPDVNESLIDYTGRTEKGEDRRATPDREDENGDRHETPDRIDNDASPPTRDCQHNSSFIVHRSSFSFVRVGFGAIKNFPLDLARRIIQVRRGRPFEGLDDFLRRVKPGRDAVEKLIRTGAFDRFGVARERLLLNLDIAFCARTDDGAEQLELGGEKTYPAGESHAALQVAEQSPELPGKGGAKRGLVKKFRQPTCDTTERLNGNFFTCLRSCGVSPTNGPSLTVGLLRKTSSAPPFSSVQGEREDHEQPPRKEGGGQSTRTNTDSHGRSADFIRHMTDETELLGYGVTAHPLELLPESCWKGTIPAAELRRHIGRRVTMIGWAITAKLIRTHKSREFMKFLSCEDLTDTFEVTLFPRVYRRFASITLGPGPYRIRGKVEEEQGAVSLVADQVEVIDSP